MPPRTPGVNDGTDDVVIVEDVWGEAFEQLAGRLRVGLHPQAWADPAHLETCLAGARAVVVRNRTQITRRLLERSPRLQVVARAGVGLDNIDLQAANDLGVVVVAALGANATSVAEYTIGAAIALARRTVATHLSTRGGGWQRRAGKELAGSTWGVLGLGATGSAVAERARCMRMQVLAHDRYIDGSEPAVPDGVELTSLEQAVGAADVLSIHLPVTAQTRGLLDANLLSRLPHGSILINAGRGELLDETAVADAVESGCLAGAALDVRVVEPPVIGRLERLDNVLLTPHIAGITTQSQDRIVSTLTDDIERVLSGMPAVHTVGTARSPLVGRQ